MFWDIGNDLYQIRKLSFLSVNNSRDLNCIKIHRQQFSRPMVTSAVTEVSANEFDNSRAEFQRHLQLHRLLCALEINFFGEKMIYLRKSSEWAGNGNLLGIYLHTLEIITVRDTMVRAATGNCF